MIPESQLFDQLRKADAAGDFDYARQVKQKIEEQRTAFSQSVGFANNNIVNKYGLENTMQKLQELGANDPAEGMSGFDKFVVGVGRGATDVGQGIKQLGLRGGDLIGAVDPEDVEEYDERITKEAQLFEKGLGDSFAAGAGRLTGNIAATAPVGLGAGKALQGLTGVNKMANAGRLGTAGRMGAQGAGIGAVEGALQPVFGGDFLGQKGVQIGMGAGLGGLVGGGFGAAKGGKELLDDGVGKTVVNTINKGAKNKIAGAFVGDQAEMQARKELAERTGAQLTPGEISGSRIGQGLENLAEQSLLVADEIRNKSTIPGLESVKKFVLREADNISKSNLPVDQLGRKLQQFTKKATNELTTRRSNVGSKLYENVHKFAKGQPVVKLDNVRDVFEEIINESEGIVGADLQKMASQSAKLIKMADKPLTARQAHNQLKSWGGKASGKLFKDIEGFGADEFYKSKLSKALLRDMDNVQGPLGDKLREANTFWRKASEEIDSVEGSLFGRIAGKELSSDINGFINNTMPPEKVVDTFRRAKPSQITAAMEYMNKFDPELGKQFKANYMRLAVEEAMTNANSMGAQQVFSPTQLLNSLGVRAGKNGLEGIQRLKAIFGDKQFIQDIIELSRIKGDAFGRNFSGTAVQNEANRLISSIGQFASGLMNFGKQALGTAGHMVGIKAVKNNMIPNQAMKASKIPLSAQTVNRVAAFATPGLNNANLSSEM